MNMTDQHTAGRSNCRAFPMMFSITFGLTVIAKKKPEIIKERHVKGVDMAIYHPVGIVARKQILLCMPPQHEKYGHELKNIH